MMPYPSEDQIELADREQIYRWFLLLPTPKYVRDRKLKKTIEEPPGGFEIFSKIIQKWIEFGGRDSGIANKIMEEIRGDTSTR